MRYQNLFIAVCIAILMGCYEHAILDQPQTVFTVPTIISKIVSDSLNENINDSLLTSSIPIIGRFKFTDTVDLGNLADKILEDVKDVDYKYDTRDWIENDSLDVNGFEMYLDYSQTIYFGPKTQLLKYYPVFFVNSTASTKIFTGWDFRATGVQQAAIGGQNWQPLNKRANSFIMCGNGYMYIKVKPREFLLLLVRKYSGDYRPDVRLAIKNGQSIYVSKSFIGNISEAQYRRLDSLSSNKYDGDLEIFQF